MPRTLNFRLAPFFGVKISLVFICRVRNVSSLAPSCGYFNHLDITEEEVPFWKSLKSGKRMNFHWMVTQRRMNEMSHRWERTREDDKYSGAAPGQRPVQLVDWCDAARVERPAGPISSECLSFTHLRLGSSSSATGSSRCGRPSASQTAAAAAHTFLPVPYNPNQPVVYLLSRRMKPISLFPSSFSRLVLFIFFSLSLSLFLSLYIINNKFLFFSLLANISALIY